ncbi:hypothetical protein [Microvirga sp. VF16]|uniref:hypothetical protein n=1 Tax=Microvirga sp. VF16 TaxID=2807101 RepID=UPI00193CCAB9|nr:hypothetical protein [Microvirga sp. VF16]QRM35613.1 hypothetical protein JO965_43070 [Microvirga sp. VF16]
MRQPKEIQLRAATAAIDHTQRRDGAAGVAQPVGFSSNAVNFIASVDFTIDDEVEALVRGIRIGGQHLRGSFQAGKPFEIPIHYLPWVELPSEIRFVAKSTGHDFCSPLELRTHDDALALLGPGELHVEAISLRNGMLRGTAVNRKNGLARPHLFARVNRKIPRPLTVEHPRMLDDGGSVCHFAMQLLPTDITDQGLSVEIFEYGSDVPLTSTVLARIEDDNVHAKMIDLESRIEEIRSSTSLQIGTIASQSNDRLRTLQERIDAFIEYMMLHLLDARATEHRENIEGTEGKPKPLPKSVLNFKELIYSPNVEPTNEPKQHTLIHTIPAKSESFSYGWYNVESSDGVDFRWMGQSGILFNPEPDRLVERVVLQLKSVYAAERPSLRAFFDHVSASVEVKDGSGDQRFIIALNWPKDRQNDCFKALRIESDVAASPATAEGSHDDRTLSVSVTQVVIHYSHSDSHQITDRAH